MIDDFSQRVLFLCTGNFYRSRHAEAVFNHLARERRLRWRAESRGFRPHLEEAPLSPFSAKRLGELGIDANLTRPAPAKLDVRALSLASLVVALYEPEHRPMVERSFPAWTDRVRYWWIPDIDEMPPDEALPLVEEKTAALVGSLVSGHALGAGKDVLVEF